MRWMTWKGGVILLPTVYNQHRYPSFYLLKKLNLCLCRIMMIQSPFPLHP